MTENKTLKDIVKCPDCDCMDYGCPDYELLRAEAIKWIKELKKKFSEFCPKPINGLELDELSHARGNVLDATEFIMHFFNLSEEDLK